MVTEAQVFSARFNEALDDYGAPPFSRGRQTYVGKLFKVSPIAARKWMTGEGMPDTKKLPEICLKLHCSVDWLLGMTDVKQAQPAVNDDQAVYLKREKINIAKLAGILDEIDDYQRQHSLELSNLERAGLVRRLYSQPDNIDRRAEIADVIELSRAMRRT